MAGCTIIDTFEATPIDDGMLDDGLHGTQVSAIAAGVAPAAKLVVADIFGTSGLGGIPNSVDALNGIDWLIDLKNGDPLATPPVDPVNVVVVNMSWGEVGLHETSHCDGTPLAAAMAELIQAGIKPVAATGNDGTTGPGLPNPGQTSNTFYDGMSTPACITGVVSVGAVYDDDSVPDFQIDNGCIEGVSNVDEVPCYSQTAEFLSFLAPGSRIQGDVTLPQFGGTSFAAPHVAGAWAVLAAAVPENTASESILEYFETNGHPVVDMRPVTPRTHPRIDLPEPSYPVIASTGVVWFAYLMSSLRRKRYRRKSRYS